MNQPRLKTRLFNPALSAIKVGGGISTGYFYASNPGEDTQMMHSSSQTFLLRYLPLDEDLPVGFTGAFGETSTPSILGTPENNTEFKIEYAALTIKPVKALGLEMGLLQPNAGFENTIHSTTRMSSLVRSPPSSPTMHMEQGSDMISAVFPCGEDITRIGWMMKNTTHLITPGKLD